MEEKLQAEERSEEERINRRIAEKKRKLKTGEKQEPVEVKREKSYPPEIKRFDRVERTEKLDPIIFHLSRSAKLKVPTLKGYSKEEEPKKIDYITLCLIRSIELKIQPLREYPKIEPSGKVRPVLIKGEEYLPAFRIPELIEETAINNLSLIAPIKVLKPDATTIAIPKVRFEKILLPNCILLQGRKRQLEEDKAGAELETGEQTIAGVSESPGGEPETEEIPHFLDLLFPKGSAGEIESGEPMVICLEEPEGDSYIGTLRTICKRVYREKKGGKPKPTILSHLTDDFKREITRWMEAKDRIFSIQLSEDDWKKLGEDDWNHIWDRINELFAQGFGFIIFNKPIYFFPKSHQINIINIKLPKLDLKLKKSISSMIWGFLNLETAEEDTFDCVFEIARKKCKEKLEGVEEPYISATKRHREKEESNLHYTIKLFLVKFLAKEMKLKSFDRIKEEIKVEEEHNDVYPDIYVKRLLEVYEVETLFGEGNHSIKKIDETIEKYENMGDIRKVNIVLDNLTLLRHINELMKKKLLHRDLQKKGKRSFDLEFLTLSMEDSSLMAINKVAKKINEIVTERTL
ncbi:MAG TPA: hypothetical protein VMW67_02590 [Desulfobacteria bacterium]|nr:hypothetical protein [Desulfobacteria bacterium]